MTDKEVASRLRDILKEYEEAAEETRQLAGSTKYQILRARVAALDIAIDKLDKSPAQAEASYISISPGAMEYLGKAIIVVCKDEVVIKTKDAGCATRISLLARQFDEQDWENGYTLDGTNDGWCFLKIHFRPKHTLRLE